MRNININHIIIYILNLILGQYSILITFGCIPFMGGSIVEFDLLPLS